MSVHNRLLDRFLVRLSSNPFDVSGLKRADSSGQRVVYLVHS